MISLRNPRRAPLQRLLMLATLTLSAGLAGAAAPDGPGMARHGGDGPAFGHMLERAGASAEQRGQIEQIMKSAREELRGQREQERALHTQMRAQFALPSVDAAAVETLRQQLQALHETRSKRMTQAMLDASRVLSAEQRQQLAARMADREARGDRHDHRSRRHGG